MAGLVVGQVERRVDEREVGEQPLGAATAGHLEQVVVGVALVEVDALLDLEDLNGENGRLAVAEAGFGGEQQIPDEHAPFARRVGAVVDGRERNLRAGAGMHGVEVVHQRFHRLVRGLLRLGHGAFERERLRLLDVGFLHAGGGERLRFARGKAVVVVEHRFDFGGQRLVNLVDVLLRLPAVEQFERLAHIVAVVGRVRLGHALRERVVEVGHALSAVLIVLVGLDGYARERGVAAYMVGLA